jgi:uncharacterized protein
MSNSESFDWYSVEKRYVPRETWAETTFGPLVDLPKARVIATKRDMDGCQTVILDDGREMPWSAAPGTPTNDNAPRMFRNTEARDGFAEDGIVPVDTYGLPSAGGKVFPEPRRGDWMQTFTGHQFWPMDPRASEVFIEDIAHALSMQCRYAGHCIDFYSVAEHSWLLASYLRQQGAEPWICLWALMHDASEAYLVDVPRPVKPFLEGYQPAEARVMKAVCERFGLPTEMPPYVHELDGRIIADERANMAPCVAEWAAGYNNPIGLTIHRWEPKRAEIYFLDLYRKLEREMTITRLAA